MCILPLFWLHLIVITVLLLNFGIHSIDAGSNPRVVPEYAEDRDYVVEALEPAEAEQQQLDDCLSDDHTEPNDALTSDEKRTCSIRKRRAVGGNLPGTTTQTKNQNKSEARLLYDDFKPAHFIDYIELQGANELNHKLRPEGYAYFPRRKMLTFFPDDPSHAYPPFSYHGLYGPKIWHQLPWEDFLKLKNKSFMLLKHKCEEPGMGTAVGSASTRKTKVNDMTEMVSCQHEEFPKLPKCDSNFQSPINIIRDRARQSVLLQDYTYRHFDQDFEFLMSLPWDGTSLLTVEIMNAEKNPDDSLSSYGGGNTFSGGSSGQSGDPGSTIANDILQSPKISLGALIGTELYLDRIYIKYGSTTHEGSEHQIDGKSYSMELQFIFTKDGHQFITQYWDALMLYYTSEGKDGENAESLRGKYVHIISVFVEVVDEIDKNDAWAMNAVEEFKKLSAAAKHFWTVHNLPMTDSELPTPYDTIPFRSRGFKSTSDKTKIHLAHLIPPKEIINGKTRSSPYYTYRGSLTHPPCFEYVNYGVYEKPIQITKNLWEAFLFIPNEFDDTRFLAGNFRPVSSVYNLATDLKIQKDRDKVEAAIHLIDARPVRKSLPRFDDESEAEIYDYFGTDRGTSIICCWKILFFVSILLALSL